MQALAKVRDARASPLVHVINQFAPRSRQVQGRRLLTPRSSRGRPGRATSRTLGSPAAIRTTNVGEIRVVELAH